MSSEFTSVPEESASLNGRDFSVAPAWQYSVGTRLDVGGGAFVRLEETGRDSFYFDDSHNQKSNSYNLFNATLGYQRGGWKFMVWSRNLFNQTYAVRGFYFGNEPPDYPNKLYIQRGDPRTFGATVSYAF
jgi:outer membrane receptor for ferric coprogen and ferric-rhodotorulic acid